MTGIYFFDNSVLDKAKWIKPSKMGELEISDIINLYLKDSVLSVEKMSRGMNQLDTGTIDSLHEASSNIRSLEKRQGLKICFPEAIAWRLGFINIDKLYQLSLHLSKSGYGDYLQAILT